MAGGLGGESAQCRRSPRRCFLDDIGHISGVAQHLTVDGNGALLLILGLVVGGGSFEHRKVND